MLFSPAFFHCYTAITHSVLQLSLLAFSLAVYYFLTLPYLPDSPPIYLPTVRLPVRFGLVLGTAALLSTFMLSLICPSGDQTFPVPQFSSFIFLACQNRGIGPLMVALLRPIPKPHSRIPFGSSSHSFGRLFTIPFAFLYTFILSFSRSMYTLFALPGIKLSGFRSSPLYFSPLPKQRHWAFYGRTPPPHTKPARVIFPHLRFPLAFFPPFIGQNTFKPLGFSFRFPRPFLTLLTSSPPYRSPSPPSKQ